jgi:integrase
MAHVQKKTYVSKKTGKRSISWQARFYAPDGRQHARRFTRRVDAEAWLCENGAAISKGSWIDPTAGKVSFETYAETWQASQVHRVTTAEQVRLNLNKHILPAFKSRPIGAIRTSEVQSWVKRLSDRLAPGTVEVVYRYFASICRSAVHDRLIAFSPCEGVKLPRKEVRRVVPLETTEVLALIDAMPDRYRAAAVVAAGAGLRQGEVFGLTADRVDFPRRILTVDRQLVTVSKMPPFLGPPKTAAGTRTIPISETVLFALSQHMTGFPLSTEGLLFTSEDGSPLPRNRAADVFRLARRRATTVRQDATWHDLRHYYASLLIRHGESVKTVQARLGHASAVETLDTYAHLWPDSEDRTRQAIEEELGGPLEISAEAL